MFKEKKNLFYPSQSTDSNNDYDNLDTNTNRNSSGTNKVVSNKVEKDEIDMNKQSYCRNCGNDICYCNQWSKNGEWD